MMTMMMMMVMMMSDHRDAASATKVSAATFKLYTSIMLSICLNDNPDLKELVYFLTGRLARAQLINRQWMKPEPRFAHVWTWIQKYSRMVKNRSEVIVTRSSVKLRV
jgi:hypothetical protein